MDGQVGDHIEVPGRRVGHMPARGEIVEVLTGPGTRHYRVRWEDGHETTLAPGPGVTVQPRATGRRDRRALIVDLRLEEDRDDCTATATMMTAAGGFTATGSAHRHPRDPAVPVIGEELAIARCLRALADRLEQAASSAMSEGMATPDHLVG